MAKSKIRKFKYGTTGVSVQNYMPSPAEVLAENDIMMTKAELSAETNPLARGVQLGTALFGSVLNSNLFANGTSGATGRKAEVEGGETFETPTGQVGEFKGPTHEQGGIGMDIVSPNQPISEDSLPAKTKIYSDRIIKDGKKLSDRKKSRDAQVSKLEKLLETNSDQAIKNTSERRMKAIEREDQEDLDFQEMASMFEKMTQFAFGTGKEGVKFAGGTSDTGVPNFEEDGAAFDLEDLGERAAIDAKFLKKQSDPYALVDTGVPKETKVGSYVPKIGDAVGMIGDVISAFGPTQNTLQNRAGDSPNINAYKNFGKDSLETLDKAGENLGIQKDISKQRLAGQTRASKKTGRANARGINQVRATDFLTDMGSAQGEQNIDMAYANQVRDLLTKKSGLQSNIDQVVMGGEQAADLANRQDRDMFFTNMSKDIATKGQGVQQIGKDLNDVSMNSQVLKLLQQFGKYVSYDNKGNLIAKK